jgi:hypothetical protein
MQLMSAGQITDNDCYVILDPDFCYIQDRRTGHLVGTGPVIMIHSIFGSLTSFVFLLLCSPVLSALPPLLHPRHRLLSGIIVWAIFVAPDYLHDFVNVF